jgi:hypothetical protein
MSAYAKIRGSSNGVACPKCGTLKGATVDSRPQAGIVRRRRQCGGCQHRFTTYETLVEPGDRGLSDTQKKILRGVLGTIQLLVKQLAP